MDIFKCMKQYMDDQLSKCSSSGTSGASSAITNAIAQEFICPECKIKFSSNAELNNHQTCVHANIDRTCTRCNFKAQTIVEFRTHIEACHVPNHQYTCSDCNYKMLKRST